MTSPLRGALCIAIMLTIASSATLHASDDVVLMPPGYTLGEAVPAVVYLLPPGPPPKDFIEFWLSAYGAAVRGAQSAYETWINATGSPRYILIVPAITIDVKRSFNANFAATESTVIDAVDLAKARYRVHDDAVYLAGFSYGGDIAFAMCIRSPMLYCGAIINSSRCAVRDKAYASGLNAARHRFSMMIGDRDLAARRTSIQKANAFLQKSGAASELRIIRGLSHTFATPADFSKAASFVLPASLPEPLGDANIREHTVPLNSTRRSPMANRQHEPQERFAHVQRPF